MHLLEGEENQSKSEEGLISYFKKGQTRWGLERSLDLGLHGLLALMKKPLEGMSDKSLEEQSYTFWYFTQK